MGGQIRRGGIWRFWGAPIVSPEVSNTYFEGFWYLWTENRGAPKTPNPTTTDLTSHLRPSEFSLRNWPISSADFPMTPMEGTDTILALFGRRILGQYPAAPCSPGPVVLLKHRQVTDLDVTVLGFSGPGLPSARQMLCGDAPRLFSIILVCI